MAYELKSTLTDVVSNPLSRHSNKAALAVGMMACVVMYCLVWMTNNFTATWVIDICSILSYLLTLVIAICMCYVFRWPAMAFVSESGEFENSEGSKEGGGVKV